MNEVTPAAFPETGCAPAPTKQARRSRRPLIMRLLGRILHAINLLVLVPALLWLLGLAVWQTLSLCVTLPLLAIVWLQRSRYRLGRLLWLPVAGGAVYFMLLPPPHPEAWQKPWGREPGLVLEGRELVVENLRDFRYRSTEDYDVRYRRAVYDLGKLTGVDFVPCHWDGHEFFCHTMLVFNFSDGQHLVVSPETRLPEGEEQNGLAGLYKRYGILYVFGSEDDIFALRSNYRHEDLYLFPLNITPEQAQALLRHIVAIAQQSSERHEAYNTLTDNCSTAIVKIFSPMRKLIPLQYRLLPINNGRIAELLYRFGAIKTREGESWQQLRERCRVGYDIIPAQGQSYSQALRLRTEHPDTETAAQP